MRKLLFVSTILFFSQPIFSQTLFTYGSKKVSKEEFIKAFDRTPNPDSNRAAALKEYLDLYINYKLKVQGAYDEKLNENAEYKTEADNFKSQLAENVINQQANIVQMEHEAFERGQKNIHLRQIFIPVSNDADSAHALTEITKAYSDLQGGKSFDEVLATYSDEATQKTKGDLGYVTVFTLPYEIENIVYALHTGGYSKPYRSSIGYHIFKNEGERPALGKRVVSQILFAVAPDATDDQKQVVAKKADSVYALLQHGASFETMRLTFSNVPGAINKKPFEVGVGQFAGAFEQQIFALKDSGEISKPFETPYGYNILKLIKNEPVLKDPTDAETKAALQQEVVNDGRLAIAKRNLIANWLKITGYKPAVYNADTLWAFTDSSLKDKAKMPFKTITKKTVLFSFAKQNVTANDWVEFAQAKKASDKTMDKKSYPGLMKEFVNISCGNYYRAHLDELDTSLRQQLKDFNEANLLFAAMDKHVWTKAGSDSAGLQEYYSAHKPKYMWGPSLSAVVISADTKDNAMDAAATMKKSPSNWRSIASSYGAGVTGDSSRFEQDQLPVQAQGPFEKGFISVPQKSGDNYIFMYVTQVYPQQTQRSFEDARGMVINDYQQVVEAKWVAALKQKYPVTVNEAVLKSIK